MNNSTLEKCVRCGSCINVCPIFEIKKSEEFTPRGKLFFMNFLEASEDPEEIFEETYKDFARAIFDCTACQYCLEVCESEVDILSIFEKYKRRAIEKKEFKKPNRIIKTVLMSKNIYKTENVLRNDFLKMLESEVPFINDRIFRGKPVEVVFFVGCVASFRSSQQKMLVAALNTLEYLRISYCLLGGKEFCCTHPLNLLGFHKEGEEIRTHNFNVFEETKATTIITNCPGCLLALRGDPKINNEYSLFHLTEFLDAKLMKEDFIPLFSKKLHYHDPCELFRGNNVRYAPRSLLKKMGIPLYEHEPFCCGGGGALRLTDPELSESILAAKKQREELQDTIVSCCPSCHEQFQNGQLESIDIVELVWERLNKVKGDEEL